MRSHLRGKDLYIKKKQRLLSPALERPRSNISQTHRPFSPRLQKGDVEESEAGDETQQLPGQLSPEAALARPFPKAYTSSHPTKKAMEWTGPHEDARD